jgi:hypothetical protein
MLCGPVSADMIDSALNFRSTNTAYSIETNCFQFFIFICIKVLLMMTFTVSCHDADGGWNRIKVQRVDTSDGVGSWRIQVEGMRNRAHRHGSSMLMQIDAQHSGAHWCLLLPSSSTEINTTRHPALSALSCAYSSCACPSGSKNSSWQLKLIKK